ncbi:glycosyltransferase family 2 protein [Paenibacillus sp. CC-CFT742]|nr:glycosyltransferase family 2 protein [Paenibacillus sp. CC-CFT742]WJH27491.1 glycosyltransferase family 2 protein [Paenibacillus sp. CC-CFT742]
MSLPISVCILTLNEEEHIRDSINSISNFVDEVVVLDSGSVDRTIEEAKLTGAKIHTIKWKDDFSYARNKLIDLASSPFILMMDADERYIGDGSDLQTYIENSVSAGRVKIINLLDEEEQTETAIIRIFRKNPSLRYKGIIHEQLTDRGNAITGVNSEISLLHFGYKRESMEKKIKRKEI